MIDNFYRDIAALREPGPLQTETGASHLTGWIMDQMGVHFGHAVMDLGCGNGKRTLPLAQVVGERGYVLAVDRSFESLSMLSQQSQDMRLETRIRFLQISLDDFEGHVRNEEFDRALASRTLHFVRQPRAIFYAIQLALKPGGIFFFYGPTRQDHRELRQFHAGLSGESFIENREPSFVEGIGLQCTRDFFSQVELVRFEQPLRFETPEALYGCWSVSKLYDETLEQAFQLTVKRYFASHRFFETVQRIVGIRAVK
jgi:SAM-dependent methyltransferase